LHKYGDFVKILGFWDIDRDGSPRDLGQNGEKIKNIYNLHEPS
jgi:hypothetical protein